jgi:hypothetical protein
MKRSGLWFSMLFLGSLAMSVLIIGCDDDDDDTMKEVVYDLSGPASAANERQQNPVNSTATGNITGTYNENTNTLQYTITWNGLTAPASAMHFHGPATPQLNAGVMIPIPGAQAVSGTISETLVVHDTVEAHLLNGMVYYNIHTPPPSYPAGEIRGNIVTTKRP